MQATVELPEAILRQLQIVPSREGLKPADLIRRLVEAHIETRSAPSPRNVKVRSCLRNRTNPARQERGGGGSPSGTDAPRDRRHPQELGRVKLPGGDRAIVDIAKLRDYCLNPGHPRGRHKARVFASTLGLTPSDAGLLRENLLRAAREGNATSGYRDEYGQRYSTSHSTGVAGERPLAVRGLLAPTVVFRA